MRLQSRIKGFLLTFLGRTDSSFNKVILRSLFLSKTNKPPVSVSQIARSINTKGAAGKTIVVVGTVTDDKRLFEFPKATVAALRFTAGAKATIAKAGGETLTLDQLALRAPKGENTTIIRGPRSHRESVRHFGFGPHSKKAPRILNTGKQRPEMGRGRRKNMAFKV